MTYMIEHEAVGDIPRRLYDVWYLCAYKVSSINTERLISYAPENENSHLTRNIKHIKYRQE